MLKCPYNGFKECDWEHCAADTVCLSAGEISTVHEGRLHYWKCKAYEESEESKMIRNFLAAQRGKVEHRAQE